MYEMGLDTSVHFYNQDCLPLTWGTFISGCPMMEYGPVCACTYDTTSQPQLDMQENMQLTVAGSQTLLWDPKSKKPCNCTKSQCLKLYCECFANGKFCNNCNCNNCCNNLENKETCFKAARAYVGKHPEVFQHMMSKNTTEDFKLGHEKGCQSKQSDCLKNYCECSENKLLCSSNCKCIGCRNYEKNQDCTTLLLDTESVFWTVTSLDVVRAACKCLLAQAEKAEEKKQSACTAEQGIIEEFGNCLAQMLQTKIQREIRA